MADFAPCFAFVLGNEAGDPPNYNCVDDPTAQDSGAQACAGINSYDFASQFNAIAAVPPAQRAPLVEQFYQTTYWNQWIDALNSTQLAAMVMDAEVNEGPGTGVMLLQTACNSVLTVGQDLSIDGLWGPLTVAAANGCDQEALATAFVAARVARYQAIAAANPSEAANLPGWLARAQKVPLVT